MITNTTVENKSGDGDPRIPTTPTIKQTPDQPQLTSDCNVASSQTVETKDNGILEFMTLERITELYKRIHSQGVPDLEWRFYGRRKPDEPTQETNEVDQISHNEEANVRAPDTNQDEIQPTAFDFDESFSELHVEESIINDSLQLKRRSEPGCERKTNLSDIMSDIIKETSHVENE